MDTGALRVESARIYCGMLLSAYSTRTGRTVRGDITMEGAKLHALSSWRTSMAFLERKYA